MNLRRFGYGIGVWLLWASSISAIEHGPALPAAALSAASQGCCLGNITDDFGDGNLSPYWMTTSECSGAGVVETGGRIMLQRPPAGPNCPTAANVSMWLQSPYQICGDFDIRIDFDVTPWTSVYDVQWLSLEVATASHHFNIERNKAGWGGCRLAGESYKSFYDVWDDCGSVFVPTSDFTGKLRIARTGSVVGTYYWNGSGWTNMQSATWITDPVTVVVYSGSSDGTTPVAYVDNFYAQSTTATDTDNDGVPDCIDNCPTVANPEQVDADHDGYGAACDCNDSDSTIHPGGIEICDGKDNNCVNGIDELPFCGVAVCDTAVLETLSICVPNPGPMAFSPGGDYGNYLYVASYADYPTKIYRVSSTGQCELFATPRSQWGAVTSLAFDETPDRRYGGLLYMAIDYRYNDCYAGIDKILPDGTVQAWVDGCSSNPPLLGMASILIDRTGHFGYNMYLADFEVDEFGRSGSTIHAVSPSGSFGPVDNIMLQGVTALTEDVSASQFGGDMLANNLGNFDWMQGNNGVYRIKANGSYSLFIPYTGSNAWGPTALLVDALGEFDGNLLAHYSYESRIAVFNSVGVKVFDFAAKLGDAGIPDRFAQDLYGYMDYGTYVSGFDDSTIYRIRRGGGTDTDQDLVADGCDNCPSTANPLQEDVNHDGRGDACDNTKPGSNVRVDLDNGVKAKFVLVTQTGWSACTIGNTGPSAPQSRHPVPRNSPRYYDVTTNALVGGDIEVCVLYSQGDITGPENELELWHHNGSVWTEVTQSVDTITNTICGLVTSLSPFLVTEPCCLGVTGNINTVGIVDLADLSALVSYLTGGGYVLPCFDEANVNTSGIVDLADLSALVSYLTGGGYVMPNCP